MTNGETNVSDMFNQTITNNADQANENTNVGTIYIGEGKKYKSIEDADKAFGHLNSHLEKLEKENEELRERTKEAKTIEEVLQAMKHQQTNTMVQDDYQQTSDSNRQSSTIDKDAIINEAVNRISQMKQKEIEDANAKEVVNSLTKKYGEKAGQLYKAKAEELGIDLDTLAKRSPKAVLEFFKDSSVSKDSASEVGTYNTATLGKDRPQHGTYEYWNELHRQGKITREEKFRRQHESLDQLGADKFYGRT